MFHTFILDKTTKTWRNSAVMGHMEELVAEINERIHPDTRKVYNRLLQAMRDRLGYDRNTYGKVQWQSFLEGREQAERALGPMKKLHFWPDAVEACLQTRDTVHPTEQEKELYEKHKRLLAWNASPTGVLAKTLYNEAPHPLEGPFDTPTLSWLQKLQLGKKTLDSFRGNYMGST